MICAVSDGHETGTAAPGSLDRSAAARDHLANERTLLAWQRTSLALLGLGFLADRFAFEGSDGAVAGSIVGLALIAVGALASLAGMYRYLRTERDIDRATYRPAHLAHLLLTGAVVLGAAMLVIVLLVEPAG
jgi:putative membrane protein